MMARFWESREFWMSLREIALHFVDIVERGLEISPRTSELRKQSKTLPRATGAASG